MNPTQSDHFNRVNKARSYPFVTFYKDKDNGLEIDFTYIARLHDAKLLFYSTVKEPNSGDCFVKFTQQYSEAAHSYLASRGWAPSLRQCVRLTRNWIIVFMDVSNYRVVYGLDLTNAEKEKLQREVEKMTRSLHEGGFVHGDIRDLNLTVDPDSLSSDEVKVHLVDFDWAGRIGEATYRIGLNCESVRRPAGVGDGKLITEEHGIEMVSYLTF